ncbi:MAG: hypothetical protein HGA75_11475 [Thiobacillus sp.]|nr:hypothetical protein [Thiobacillus sp.]
MKTVFQNRTALFGWVLSALFLLFVAAMTYVLLRDGPPPGYPWPAPAILMGLFWLFGLAGAGYCASKPCLTVTAGQASTLVVVRRYPFGREERRVPLAEVEPARVIESRDDDGDPYFQARAELNDGSRLDLAEGHDRARCESVCARFNQALSS